MEDIHHTIRTPASEEKIIEALTTVTGLTGWWGRRTTLDNSSVTLHFTKDGQEVTMEFEVESRANPVTWRCVRNDNPAWVETILTWSITDSGDSREIDFRHTGFRIGGPPYESTVAIWQHFVNSLQSYLAAGVGEPWP